jgi:hypothetical protein
MLASGLAELTWQHELRAAERRRSHEAEWDAIGAGITTGDSDQSACSRAHRRSGRPHCTGMPAQAGRRDLAAGLVAGVDVEQMKPIAELRIGFAIRRDGLSLTAAELPDVEQS